MKTIIAEGEPPVSTSHHSVHAEPRPKPEEGLEREHEQSYSRTDRSLEQSATTTKAKCCDRWGHTCEGCHASIKASEGDR